jgi:hypothetical protein
MIVSALSPAQSKELARIQSLPAAQQKEAALALLSRTFNASACNTIRCIFNM